MAALPRYRKILLATDGSDSAEQAAGHAVALARQTGAALAVISVMDTRRAFGTGIYRGEASQVLRRDGERALAAVADLARAAGLDTETDLVEGSPAEAIVAQAERSDAALIIIGSHGQGALADVLLGSVSQAVLRRASVPVCIVRTA